MVSAMCLLYPEEHVANLVDHLRISARFTAWETLEGGEDEIGGVLEVEHRLHVVKIIGRLVGECAVFDPNAPLTAPTTIGDILWLGNNDPSKRNWADSVK